jgi:tRNA A-37 threonylcarbamoyl transferase component Bud32
MLLDALAVEATVPFSLWQFALYFPAVTRFTAFDRLARRMLMPVGALSALLVGVNLFKLGRQSLLPGTLEHFYRTDSSNLYSHLVVIGTLGAVVAVAVRTRRANPAERMRVRRLGISLAIGMSPILLLGLALMAWPPFNRWFFAQPGGPAPINFLVRAGFALIPIGTAFAIVSDRALDVRVAMSRATQYLLTRSLLTALTVTPLALLGVLLYQRRDINIGAALSDTRGSVLLGWLAAAVLLLVAREPILRGIDARFGHRTVNHRAEFTASLERVKNARGLRETTATVTKEIRSLLQTRVAAIIDVELQRESALAAMLQQEGGCLDSGTDAGVFELLPEDEKAWLAEHGFDSLTAVRRRDGSLLAAIAVGPKRSGLPLTDDDRWLLESLASVMAVVWEAPQPGQVDAGFECPACGVVTERASPACECGRDLQPAAVPARLNAKFQLIRRIGRGGMGVVYEARDVELDRLVAVKTLPSASPDTIAQIRKEARAMASLNHPGLAAIYGVEVWQHTPSLIVEYCAGGTLAERLRKRRLGVPEAVHLGLGMLDALIYMHGAGVTHRDIKPSNIGLTASGVWKLLDFGLSGAEGTAEGGTPLYMPPESVDGCDEPAARDRWSTALVMFESIAGANPFADATAAGVRRRITTQSPPELERWRAVDVRIADFLRTALANRSQDRFSTAASMRAALAALTGDC